MTQTEILLLDLVVSLVGSGLGTTIVGALFKRQFDKQLETHKALLQRSGRIHERQVDALVAIHSKLEGALFYFQRITSPGRLQGESEEKLEENMIRDLAEASQAFSQNRLLLGEVLQRKLDDFFSQMVFARIDLGILSDPLVQGELRAKLWGSAQERAYRDLPPLLEAIRAEARAVIHS